MGSKSQEPNKGVEEVSTLIERAQEGDDAAYTELTEYVGDNPRFWRRVGDLAEATQESWLQMILGKDKLAAEGVRRRLRSMKRDLLASGDSPLERLLAERIAVCRLQVQCADLIYAQNLKDLGVAWG